MRRLTLAVLLVYLWLTALPGRWTAWAARPPDDDRDRGDALVAAVVTVGLVLIAAVVLLVLRAKAEQTADNICTNTDPTTCVQQ